MNGKILFFLTVAATLSAAAQSIDSVQRAEINKLGWWVGKWEGKAWNSTEPGKQDTTTMVETIRKNLDGTIILVEGVGRRLMPKQEKGAIVHHAFAVLSYDEKKLSFRWQAWRIPGGIYTEAAPAVTDSSFSWSMESPRGKMRYSIKLNEKKQWEETGEFSSDGQNWHPFFGMLLNKVR